MPNVAENSEGSIRAPGVSLGSRPANALDSKRALFSSGRPALGVSVEDIFDNDLDPRVVGSQHSIFGLEAVPSRVHITSP